MTYLVGFGRGRSDRAALDLAAQLARSGGASLTVVTVVPQTWPTPVAGGVDREFAQWAAAEGDRACAEALAMLADGNDDVPAQAVWAHGRSVPQTLLAQAEERGADLLVVGSGSAGAYGHISVSSTADRLLHSSPVPVAVAPRGYRGGGRRVVRATCAFRGDDAARATLERTAEICARVGARLRVATFGVRGRPMVPPPVSGAEQMVLDAWLEQAAAAQAEALKALGERGLPADGVEVVVGVGRSWGDALDDIAWEPGDVLVIGSSSSRFDRVFLGSSAAKILRHSPVPAVVVP